MVTLDPCNLHTIVANEMFEQHMGPLGKFSNGDFINKSCSEDKAHADARDRFGSAIESVVSGKAGGGNRVRVRDIEMTTVTDANSGFPIHKHFDWFISKSSDFDGLVILLGDPVSDQEESQREKELELVDFFQNAPIALHWLTGEGNVLWANQTELNVLGYTAEEYIGQPIMNFCPDEQELVLEIFKQLGSGNIIKDVPVRVSRDVWLLFWCSNSYLTLKLVLLQFRTKDGRIVYLLIDSNVKYNSDGSFGHTRCFIRDDTGRKIREARASLLLEETKRSLKMLDNFMAQTLHHLR
jgi:PAS domain-containing protein